MATVCAAATTETKLKRLHGRSSPRFLLLYCILCVCTIRNTITAKVNFSIVVFCISHQWQACDSNIHLLSYQSNLLIANASLFFSFSLLISYEASALPFPSYQVQEMKGWAHKSNLPVTGIAGGRAPNLYLVHFNNIHIHTHPHVHILYIGICMHQVAKRKKIKHPLCNLILILKRKSKATTWRLQIYNYRQFVTVDTFIIGKSRWLGRYYVFLFFKKHPDLVSIISNHDRQLLKQIFHYY